MKKFLNVFNFTSVLVLGVALLISRFIDGAAFVAFVVAGCLGASIYALLPSITEFSIGGNSVKFKEKLNEAERITAELRKLKAVAIRTTLKSLKIKQKENLLVFQNIIEFRDVYQLISDAKEFENDYRMIVTETAFALRENVFDFVDLDIKDSGPHDFDWRDSHVREYIGSKTNQSALPFREKMSVRFAEQYIYLTNFIDGLSKGGLPSLKIVSQEEGWHVIVNKTTWKDL
ncbi:hypothetical protein LF934_19685 [Dickeya dadantii]|uniref:hypothetical protein n=1 Tax=Dickeya dadantii TaxID=204038 RepID=UPI001CF0E871|nr:hypothetical protein [Dickeya dadantii]MCA7014857.1 hypothetical protein [Dickeya dadantii]